MLQDNSLKRLLNTIKKGRKENIMYIDKDGVTRWDTNKKYTKKELKQQREEFEKVTDSGAQLCLSDLMITHGM